jgi:hypothetical protein
MESPILPVVFAQLLITGGSELGSDLRKIINLENHPGILYKLSVKITILENVDRNFFRYS